MSGARVGGGGGCIGVALCLVNGGGVFVKIVRRVDGGEGSGEGTESKREAINRGSVLVQVSLGVWLKVGGVGIYRDRFLVSASRRIVFRAGARCHENVVSTIGAVAVYYNAVKSLVIAVGSAAKGIKGGLERGKGETTHYPSPACQYQ